MWISKKKYEKIIARLDELETATRVPCTGYGYHVGLLVYLLMQHLKVHPWTRSESTELVQKDGPERG